MNQLKEKPYVGLERKWRCPPRRGGDPRSDYLSGCCWWCFSKKAMVSTRFSHLLSITASSIHKRHPHSTAFPSQEGIRETKFPSISLRWILGKLLSPALFVSQNDKPMNLRLALWVTSTILSVDLYRKVSMHSLTYMFILICNRISLFSCLQILVQLSYDKDRDIDVSIYEVWNQNPSAIVLSLANNFRKFNVVKYKYGLKFTLVL